MTVLETLAKDHDVWLRHAKVITSNIDKAEELLQDFYLHIGEKELDGKIELKGDFNKYKNFIFVSMKNYYIDQHRKDKKNEAITVSLTDELEQNVLDVIDTDIKQREAFYEFYQHIERYMNSDYKDKTIKDYETKNYKIGLLKLNYFHGMSHETISRASSSEGLNDGISARKVQISIESIRKIIKNKYWNEYQQYRKKINEL